MSRSQAASSSSGSASSPGLWQNLLNEVSTKNRGIDDSRNVILFGDRLSGRSTIVQKLRTMFNDDGQQQRGGDEIEVSRPGLALDYSYLDLRIDDSSLLEDTVARVNLWELTQESSILSTTAATPSPPSDTLHLLDLVVPFSGAALARSVVLICLDISKPWDIDATLKNWLQLLSKHVERVRREDPAGFQAEQDALLALRRAAQQRYRQLLDKKDKQQQQQQVDEAAASQQLFDIDENLALPVVVVVTKTDQIASLQRNYDYSNDAFDYINQHVRRTCLKYGAGLVYISNAASAEHWADFWQYVQDELFRRPFTRFSPALADRWLTEREELVYPAGADSLDAVNQVFFHQSMTADPEEAYEVVVPIPSFLHDRMQTRSAPPAVAVAETATQFLQRHYQNLGLGSAPGHAADKATATPDSKSGTAAAASGSPLAKASSAATVAAPTSAAHLDYMDFFNSVLSDAPAE